MTKKYKTAKQFRIALLDRLADRANKEGVPVQRLQRKACFDQLLCRLFSNAKVPWLLKGGHALELRIQRARATKDLDLAIKEEAIYGAQSETQKNKIIFEQLQERAAVDLGDFFEFLIQTPVMDLENAPYGGARFPVEASIDGRVLSRFHLDVAIGDVWIEPVENIKVENWLSFTGFEAIAIPIINIG